MDGKEVLRIDPGYNMPIIELPEKVKGTDVGVTLI